MYQYFIPFYGQIIFHRMVYHILFSCLSVDEHLGCFYVLTVMSSGTVNIHVRLFYGAMYLNASWV